MVEQNKTGVLLVNLGSPSGTDFWSVRSYLKEFLSDRRVVEIPRPIWWLILNGIILNTRPQKSGKKYEEIWDKQNDCAPLVSITRKSAKSLAAAMMASDHPDLVIDWAMRYGEPTIAARIDHLMEQGCERILLVPLYPQYSASTTASVIDAVGDALKKIRHQPETDRLRCPIIKTPPILRRWPHRSKADWQSSTLPQMSSSRPFMACQNCLPNAVIPYPRALRTDLRPVEKGHGRAMATSCT